MDKMFRVRLPLATLLLAAPLATAVHAQRGGRGGAPVDSTVPSNLRAMLAPKGSEMRLVLQHYANDRTLLAGNYAAAQPPQGRGGGGGGGAGAGGGGRGRGGTDTVATNDSTSGR